MKAITSSSFTKVMQFAKPYKTRFIWVVVFSITLSLSAAIRPYLLKLTVDEYMKPKDKEGLLHYIILMMLVLMVEVLSQFYFVYWASWFGQDLVKDLREKLFNRISHFRMKFFDNEAVGRLVTRTVFDIESISKIFSQGLFMIISDLLKMLVVLIVMFAMNWKLSVIMERDKTIHYNIFR